MLVPDPKVVRTLLTRYASLRIAQAECEKPQTARELADVSRALCVVMGAVSVENAIAEADALLIASRRTTGRGGGLSLAV
ncbi:DUF5133 domain-containing protein [Streptomyces sp. NPDC050534]|uniref:DUF5133 domain-containing protein n=1 Tax=Streptomyces sp. NPDC050534 TaxID=3365625 RepID=UPI0037BAC49E